MFKQKEASTKSLFLNFLYFLYFFFNKINLTYDTDEEFIQ